MIIRGLLMVAALFLAGCQNKALISSIPGGESKVFEEPPYEVHGKTKYDQNWIDSQIEGGVAAYGWRRPSARPAEIDAPSAQVKHVATADPKKNPGILKRIRATVTGKSPAASPEPVPYVTEPLPPAAPPKPRSAVDELLYPTR